MMNVVAHSVSYALDGQEDGVERLLNALGLVQVERVDRDDVVAAGAAELQAVRAYRLDVRPATGRSA